MVKDWGRLGRVTHEEDGGQAEGGDRPHVCEAVRSLRIFRRRSWVVDERGSENRDFRNQDFAEKAWNATILKIRKKVVLGLLGGVVRSPRVAFTLQLSDHNSRYME